VDDVVDGGDIQSSSGDIGGKEDTVRGGFEADVTRSIKDGEKKEKKEKGMGRESAKSSSSKKNERGEGGPG
jgi:hypothetical protein